MSRRCVIYTRRSKKDSKKDKHHRERSTEQQLRLCREVAAARDFEIVDEISENQSAYGDGRSRPEFARVLDLGSSGEVDVILVSEEDRISRNGTDNQDLLTAERANPGLEVWCANGRIPWKTFESDGGKYVRDLVKKTERGWRTSMRQGKPGPGKHLKYGYRRNRDEDSPMEGFAEIHPENAEFVRAIFQMYSEGVSARSTFETLKAKGCARNFDRMALNRIIKDEAYVTGLQPMVRKAKYGFPEETFQAKYPPIIDDAMWEAAQKQLAANKSTNLAKAPLKKPSLLAGLVWCEECDWKMHMLNRPGKYRCGHNGKKLQAPNPQCAKTIGISWLDNAVWEQVRNFVNTPSLLDQLIDNRAAELRASIRDDAEDEILRLTEKLSEIDAKADKYMELYIETQIPKELLEKHVLGLEFEKAAVKRELELAESELISRLNPEETKKQARRLLGSWKAAENADFLADLDLSQRLVRKCVEKVTVQPGSAGTKVPTIYFRIEVPAVQMPSVTELERTIPNMYHVPASC